MCVKTAWDRTACIRQCLQHAVFCVWGGHSDGKPMRQYNAYWIELMLISASVRAEILRKDVKIKLFLVGTIVAFIFNDLIYMKKMEDTE